MPNHIIKYDYSDGKKLPKHKIETWCGHAPEFSDWLFQDAQHALLSVEQCSSVEPCKECLKAIMKVAEQEVSTSNKLIAEVVAWDDPTRERRVDFRWVDTDVPPGTKLYAVNYPVIPEGWKLVPKKLTPEMEQAWDAAPNGCQADWDAMLNVAPSPANGGEW